MGEVVGRSAVAGYIRAFHTQPIPEMGWRVEQREFGLYRWNEHAPGYETFIVRGVSTAAVPRLVAGLRNPPARDLEFWVDDRYADAKLQAALAAAGLQPRRRITCLAFTGTPPEVRPVPGLVLTECSPDDIPLYVETKQRAFGDSEDLPKPTRIARELPLRRAEHKGGARLVIANVDGQPSGVMCWYEGPSCDFVHQLGTRVPFREMGIARYLLSWLISDALSRGKQSVVIDADEDRTPVQFYRRLGFVEEVYWRREYLLPGR